MVLIIVVNLFNQKKEICEFQSNNNCTYLRNYERRSNYADYLEGEVTSPPHNTLEHNNNNGGSGAKRSYPPENQQQQQQHQIQQHSFFPFPSGNEVVYGLNHYCISQRIVGETLSQLK